MDRKKRINTGKIFEEDFHKSVDDNILLYRLPDSAQSFGKSTVLRFSSKNPFDYLLWDSISLTLYALELKTVKGKSISFEREQTDKGKIHYHQIQGLNDWNRYNGIICGFIISFRELDSTVFIEISQFNRLMSSISKKSFTLQDLIENQIDYITIQSTKKKTRYSYDVRQFIDQSSFLSKISK